MNKSAPKATIIGLLLLANILLVVPPATAQTSSRSAADISVTEVQALGGPHFKGDNITITALIKNLGTQNATNVTVHMEAWNNTLSTPIDLGNDTTIGHENGGSNLTFNESVLVTFHWNTSLSGLGVSAGLVYSINVTAKNLSDASSANDLNMTTVTFLDEPYLIIAKADPSGTAIPIGDPFNISYRVENIGSKNQDVLGDNIQLFLDLESVPLESHAIQGLTPHKSAQGLFIIDTDAIAPGNHTFKISLQNAGRQVITPNISFLAPNPYIGKLEWTPLNGSVGDEIIINATIHNNGTTDAKDLVVKFFVDPPYQAETYSAIVNITPGGTNVSSFVWNTTGIPVGNHTVKVSLKPFWASENITGNISLKAGGVADLAVQSVTLVPNEVDIGETVNITALIKNIGDWASTPTNVSIRYIKGLESKNLAMVPLKALAAGASTTVYYLWNTTGLEFWNYGIWVQADPENEVIDDNPANNKGNATLKLKAKPDLAITKLNMTMGHIEGTTVHKGESATINVLVSNIGTTGSVLTSIALYLDDGSDPVSKQKLFGMAVDGEQVLLFLWDTSNAVLGNHTFKAIVDGEGNNTELNETNNINTFTVQVLEPKGQIDMVVRSVVIAPSGPAVGDFVAISAVIRNNGTLKALNVTVLFSYYIPSGGNIPIDTQVVPSMSPGEELTKVANWATGTLASGTYSLNVTVDPLNELHEADRSNNYKAFPMSLAPKNTGPGTVNLKITSMVFDPAKPKADENVKITVTVKNTGDRDATSVRVVVIIDGVELGARTIPTIAKNGGSAPVEFQWKPKKGMHEVKAQAFVGTSAVYDDQTSAVIKASEEGGGDLSSALPIILVIIVVLIAAIALLALGGKSDAKPKKDFIEEDHEDDEDLVDEDDEAGSKDDEEE